jgi:probable F420-dependent oxidoreductase
MIGIAEHMIMPRENVELSGPHHMHSTVSQAYFAGATQRIRLTSCVTILPLQHPIITAKAIATADWLSSGRMTVSFGVGWLQREFEMLGVPFKERGRISDEYLAAIIELWTNESPTFDGRYVSFDQVAFEPKPFQRPHPPIWIGGDADGALKRAARFATGWISFLTPPEAIPARLDFIKSQPTWTDREFEVMHGVFTPKIGEGHAVLDDPSVGPNMNAQQLIDRIAWLKELGVTITAVPIPPVRSVEEYLDYSAWVIDEIKPQVQ